MKKNICRQLVISLCIGSLMFIGAGCSKKTVIPPDLGAGMNQSGMNGGTDINYPNAEGIYSENSLSSEGTLDDSASANAQGDGSGQQSFEYNKMHGRSSLGLEPIYFEFDQAGIQVSMTDVLIRNAEFLNSAPGRIVVLEGNTDDRGTSEYNLALGERRAITTQQYLIKLGVDSRRIRTVSYGEERPLFLGQDEESYSLNRRVDFVLQ